MPEITGVLLAAGQSHRFGSNKMLVEIDKQAMILRAAASLSPCDRLLAVVRQDDLPLQQLLKGASIEFIPNDAAAQGMGSSIACGIAASLDCEGWCLMPADMPFVCPSTTRHVVAALQQGATLAAPYYQNRRGHPVGFSQALANELLALNSATGARAIVEQHQQQLAVINCEDPNILIDIDTPQDLLMKRC
jgi:molybdenum cofactor cytidylyltransferase